MRNATDINILLDKSGSMQRNIEEVISGFNGYLAEQQQVFGDARLSLYQFNNRLNLTYSQDIGNALPLDRETFRPSGWTRLYDAIGKVILDIEDRINTQPEADRANKVMLAIMTDGGKNSSQEYNLERVNREIERKRRLDCWQIVFIGANLEARTASNNLSLASNSRMSAAQASSYGSAFRGLSAGSSHYRKSKDARTYESEGQRDFFNPTSK